MTTASAAGETDPVLVDLAGLVERLTNGGVSAARARHLRWVAKELGLYHQSIPAPDLATMLSTTYARAYLVVAEQGLLRTRGPLGKPSPDSTIRVRRTCLDLLARAAAIPAPNTGPGLNFTLRPKVTPTAATRALNILAAEATIPTARPLLVRAALVAALVHHHDLRTGEIVDLTLADLDPNPLAPDGYGPNGDGVDEDAIATLLAAEAVTLTYRPAAPGVGPTPPATTTLSPLTLTLLGHWLRARRNVLATNNISRVRHLLVSVHGNHNHGVHLPAGMPLQARGLARAHAGVIADLNQTLADRHGHDPHHQPLPRTLGELRPPGSEQDRTRELIREPAHDPA